MRNIKLILVVFNTELESFEMPAFRGAIVEKVGRENDLFHNHLTSDQYYYRYPMIQYKRLGKRPAILCLEQGADELYKFFQNRDWTIYIGSRQLEMKIFSLELHHSDVGIESGVTSYEIKNWLGLNSQNYNAYQELDSLVDRISMLQKLLVSNILSFAKGIGWDVDQQIIVTINRINNSRLVNFKGQQLMAFDLAFKTNAVLPDYIGLGKSVSIGYGTVVRKK